MAQRWLCDWIYLATRDPDQPTPLVDKLCDNRYCQRRSEGGYSVCVFMDDPCYFCIRFGSEDQCFNNSATIQCRNCHAKAKQAGQSTTPPPLRIPLYPGRAPHFRVLRRLDKNEDPRGAVEEEAARSNAQHRSGLIQLTEASVRIHSAVLANTHK